MKSRRAGLSLVEVIIASAILVAVVAMAMGVLFSSTRTAASGSLMTQLEQRANRTLTFFHDQMSTAAFTSPTYSNLGLVPNSSFTALGYQICGPATVQPIGAAYSMTFGYPNPLDSGNTFKANLSCFIRFEADTVYQESSSSPTATQAANWTSPVVRSFPSSLNIIVLNQDLNNNGTRTETFVSGRLMKYVVDETTNTLVGTERLDDQVILRVSSSSPGDFSGDIDGDSVADPLLTFMDEAGGVIVSNAGLSSAARLQINLWHGCRDDSGKFFILRNNKLVIHLRNERKN